jgi:hypothetical protein
MKTLRTPQQVREDINFKKLPSEGNRTPVIVTIPISARKQDLGVQFWTKLEIINGFSKNSDGSISYYRENY